MQGQVIFSTIGAADCYFFGRERRPCSINLRDRHGGTSDAIKLFGDEDRSPRAIPAFRPGQ